MRTIAELADIDAGLGVHNLVLDLLNHNIPVGRGGHNPEPGRLNLRPAAHIL